MSNQNFNISKEGVINSILKHISIQDEYKRPAQFTDYSMDALLEMKQTTDNFFNYTWCQNYVDVLLTLLKERFCCTDEEEVGFSEAKDRFNRPETVVLNRKEAEEVFFTVQFIIRYLGEMNHWLQRYDRTTKNAVEQFNLNN